MYSLFCGVHRLTVRWIFLLKWDFFTAKMDGSTGPTALESDGPYFEIMGQWPGPTINLKAWNGRCWAQDYVWRKNESTHTGGPIQWWIQSGLVRPPPPQHTHLRQGKAILLICKKNNKKVGRAGVRTSVRKIHWFRRPWRYRPSYWGAIVNRILTKMCYVSWCI